MPDLQALVPHGQCAPRKNMFRRQITNQQHAGMRRKLFRRRAGWLGVVGQYGQCQQQTCCDQQRKTGAVHGDTRIDCIISPSELSVVSWSVSVRVLMKRSRTDNWLLAAIAPLVDLLIIAVLTMASNG